MASPEEAVSASSVLTLRELNSVYRKETKVHNVAPEDKNKIEKEFFCTPEVTCPSCPVQIDERIIRDADGDTNFAVKIDVMGVPSLNIYRNESLKNSKPSDNCASNLHFNAGRACHFVATRQQVINTMKKIPLRIGIYRTNERFPVCHGIAKFTGCVCDLMSEAIEESNPFEFRGTFNLIDPGGNPSGHATLEIVLIDLGRHVTTLHALDRDSFVLKNDVEGTEYKCGRFKNVEDDATENYPHRAIDACCDVVYDREKLMRDMVGVCLGARSLSRGKPEAKEVQRQPHEHPQEPSNASKVKPGKADAKKLDKKSKKRRK